MGKQQTCAGLACESCNFRQNGRARTTRARWCNASCQPLRQLRAVVGHAPLPLPVSVSAPSPPFPAPEAGACSAGAQGLGPSDKSPPPTPAGTSLGLGTGHGSSAGCTTPARDIMALQWFAGALTAIPMSLQPATICTKTWYHTTFVGIRTESVPECYFSVFPLHRHERTGTHFDRGALISGPRPPEGGCIRREKGGGVRFIGAVRYQRYPTPQFWTVGERLPSMPRPRPSPSGRASCGCAVGHWALCCCFCSFYVWTSAPIPLVLPAEGSGSEAGYGA